MHTITWAWEQLNGKSCFGSSVCGPLISSLKPGGNSGIHSGVAIASAGAQWLLSCWWHWFFWLLVSGLVGLLPALVLSPRLRSFLHHLVRFCLFAATDLVPPVGERQLATRDRLREYRAWALATLHLWKPRNLGLDLKLTAGNLWTPRAVRFLRLVLLSSLSLWWGGGLVRIIRGRKRRLFFLWGWLTGIVLLACTDLPGFGEFSFPALADLYYDPELLSTPVLADIRIARAVRAGISAAQKLSGERAATVPSVKLCGCPNRWYVCLRGPNHPTGFVTSFYGIYHRNITIAGTTKFHPGGVSHAFPSLAEVTAFLAAQESLWIALSERVHLQISFWDRGRCVKKGN